MITGAASFQLTTRWFLLVAVVVASAAIALHSPGQISMDTSVELYEAYLGRSLSWNPPFMSALMRWLGGGELATAGLVWINSMVTYLSFVLIAGSALRARRDQGMLTLSWWRVLLCLCLILNPIVFLYVGIVWKDVLFGSSLIAAIALSVAAATDSGRRAWCYAVGAMIVLAAAAKIRQQGVFMVPVLALLPLMAMIWDRGLTVRERRLSVTVLLAVLLLGLGGFGFVVSKTIAGSDGRSSSVGFQSIMKFDIAGIVSRSTGATEALPVPITEGERAAMRATYSPTRVDYLLSNAVVAHWLNGMSATQRRQEWWALVRSHPEAFLAHRFAVFGDILDVHGIAQALPIHIGIEGNVDYLKQVGMSEQRGARAVAIYRIASAFFACPIYRHWFYLLALAIGAAGIRCAVLPSRLKSMSYVLVVAAALFYLSYLPTGISSDFRYLYGNVLLVTALWLILLAGSGAAHGIPAVPVGSADE